MGERLAQEKVEEEIRQEEQKRIMEEEENEEVKKVNKRIREVEDSIAALDWELERIEIDKMKKKTKKVIKRISQIVEEDPETGDEVTHSIKRETVRVFMINRSMWNKYLKLESG